MLRFCIPKHRLSLTKSQMPLHIQNVSKNYGDVPILKGLSLQLQKGEIVGFLGPNGAGKTTLMKILTGYLTQWDGAVQFDSFDLKKDPNAI